MRCFVKRAVVAFLAIILSACASKTHTVTEESTSETLAPIEQLYLYNETSDSVNCSGIQDPTDQLSGSMYLTKKGKIILNIHPQTPDTSYYYCGTYTLQSNALTYQITNVYCTFLQSDNFLINDSTFNPEYLNGKIRAVKHDPVTLQKAKCNSIAFVYPYTDTEKREAGKRLNGIEPYGRAYKAYTETPGMKFYTFLYKNIPAIDSLF